MKPYTIVCTTCQARLRVRKAAAIGQILACPKCGSMVLIEPPPDESASSSGSGSAPEIAPATPVPNKSSAPNKASARRKPRFREDFPENNENAAPAPAEPAGETMPVPVPPPPPIDATLTTRGRLQQWGILIAAGLTGIVLAVLVLALLAGRGCNRRSSGSANAPQTAKSASPSPGAKSGSSEPDKPTSTIASASTPKPSSTDRKQDVAESHEAKGKDASHAAETNGTPSKETATAAQKGAADAAAPTASSKNAAGSKPGSADTGTTATNNSPKNPKSEPKPTEGQLKTETPPGLVPKPDALSKPAAKEADASQNVAAANSTGSTATKSNRPSQGLTLEAGDATGSKKTDVTSRLGMMILDEELDHITLAEFARFISSLTALPVTLQLDSIIAEGLSARTELSVTVHAVTVQQMIEATLKPVGLALQIDHEQLVITTRAAIDNKTLQKTYGVADLAADAARSQALGKLITTMIAPTTWREAGGAGILKVADQKFEISQTSPVHFQITRFLDRLRVARGLRPLGKLPSEFVSLQPLFQQAGKALQAKLSLTVTKPTPVAGILQRLSTETDLLMLVDWQTVVPQGLTPRTLATLNANDQPVSVVLNRWLGSAKLAYRVVDPHTIQISTLAAVNAKLEIEFYRLPKNVKDPAAVDQLLADAEKYIGSNFFTSHGGSGTLYVDAPSRCLIAALAQPRQRALAQWLAERQPR